MWDGILFFSQNYLHPNVCHSPVYQNTTIYATQLHPLRIVPPPLQSHPPSLSPAPISLLAPWLPSFSCRTKEDVYETKEPGPKAIRNIQWPIISCFILSKCTQSTYTTIRIWKSQRHRLGVHRLHIPSHVEPTPDLARICSCGIRSDPACRGVHGRCPVDTPCLGASPHSWRLSIWSERFVVPVAAYHKTWIAICSALVNLRVATWF